MRRMTGWLTGALVLALVCPARAGDFKVEGVAWLPTLKAEGRDSSVPGDVPFSAKNDLGIDDQNFPELRLNWAFGKKSSLSASWMDLHYTGVGNVTRNITIQGTTYTAGTQVFSNFDLNVISLAYHRKLFWWPKFEIGGMLDVTTVFGDLGVNAVGFGAQRIKGTLPLPLPGLTVKIMPTKNLDLFAKGKGFPAGDYGHIYDFELGATIKPVPDVGLTAAYRAFEVEAKDTNTADFLKVRIAGPYVSAFCIF